MATAKNNGIMRIIEIYNMDGSLFDTANLSSEVALKIGAKRASVANALCGLSKNCNNFILKYKNLDNE
jgi:hypothetical protein